jgi:hypothetical protein
MWGLGCFGGEMKQGEQYNYKIVKVNHRTHVSSVVEVVKGESVAVHIAERLDEKRTEEEIAAGWSFYADRTTAPVSRKKRRIRVVRRREGGRDRGRS